MKKLLAIAIAAVSLAASATLPANLRKQIKDTDALAFFNAMDDFENTHPDGFSLVTYDSYPDGRKVIGRRIDYWNRPANTPAINRICAVFDSITAAPNPNRIVVRNINGDSQLRVYKLKDSADDYVFDLSSSAANDGSTSACINRGDRLLIAQSWTIHTGKIQGKTDLKSLNNEIRNLSKTKGAFSSRVTFAERRASAGLRQRNEAPVTSNTLDCERIIIPDARVQQWIDLHHSFMESLGADGDISLTYNRNNRMVTLVDMAEKTVYAARLSGKTLTILIGRYKDTPFLPDNWAVGQEAAVRFNTLPSNILNFLNDFNGEKIDMNNIISLVEG